MEYAQNQNEGKAVEQPVEVAVNNMLEPEIDSQILTTFMEVDPVFNLDDVDNDVEDRRPRLSVGKESNRTFKRVSSAKGVVDIVNIDMEYSGVEVKRLNITISLIALWKLLNFHELINQEDSEIVKAKVERKYFALKAKKESSDEECSPSSGEDEEYAMAVRDFKKFFKRKPSYHFIPPPSSSSSYLQPSPSPTAAAPTFAATTAATTAGAFGCEQEPKEHLVEGLRAIAVEEDDKRSRRDMSLSVWKQGFIQTLNDYLTKFDPKSYEGVFLGYSQNSKAYIILNKHTRKIEESLNVTFDETPPPSKTSPLVDDDLDEEEAIREIEKKNLENVVEDETLEIDEIVNIKESRNHPLENVIGNLNQRTLRSQAQNQSNFYCFISTIEPKNVNEALGDESWIVAMQEELNQFIANDVWELVPQPKNMTIIGTKWVFRNKLDENGVVSRNKARLVAQGYNQQEGIDYDETYAPVARLESIRILLAYACALDFKLFQMDVKSAFLNGFINEEVYVAQPPGFIDFEKPDHVYKLKKALYGLKQAPKAWYDRLKAFLIKHEYKMGMVDNTLFTKKKSSNLIIVQIYVDDIIFGLTCQDMCDEFAKIMHDEFEMSMMGELNFFLGLQIKQMEDGIFFNQSKYIKEMLKKYGLEDSKPMKTPMSSDTKLTKDEECESVDSTKYRGMIEYKRSAISTYGSEYVSAGKGMSNNHTMDEQASPSTIEYPKLKNESYVLYDRVMTPLAAQLERKPRRDRGTRRGRQSTSLSSAFDQPSSSHLNDDDDDGNDEGTSRASTPSPIHSVNSLTNQVPQVFQNPPNIDLHLEPFYTRQTKIINRQVQLRDEHCGGVRSIVEARIHWVPSIWEALGGNTHDLDSFWEETGQDYNFTRSGFKDARTVPGDGVAIPSDVAKTYKRRRQELSDGVRT
ncbi:retrovirus-related pol polyprotein from transposon TNT 1-94 [Tanacetum coccineum]|uniref:Retrovirus-related pol polyprotein from transposon TNT 1-94 n=1 Tax=Tanacetum coccineum TaxID=301880 RepID=A0ABQ5I5H9_9ASTR